MRTAEEIVDAIIADLADRKGLGDEWDAIDPAIARIIRDTWIRIVSQ